MKTELELVRSTSTKIDHTQPLTVVSARKALNKASHALRDALLKNELNPLAERLADMMIATARLLVGMELDPDLENFVFACAELLGNTRKTLDDALRFNNADDIKLATVAIEIVLKGISATLALPLDKLMVEVLAAEAEGRTADIQAMLTKEPT